MNIIKFNVEDVGDFEAKDSLTIIEEAQLDLRADEICGDKLHELKVRARKLFEDGNEDLANKIYFQILVAQKIAELEAVVVRMPENIANIGAIKNHDILFSIAEEYKKKLDQFGNDEKK